MIKNIVFDIGMVLIDFHWDTTMRNLGIPETVIDSLGKNMIHSPIWSHLDLNDMPEKDIIDSFKQANPAYSIYIDKFFNNIQDVVDVYEGATEWVKELKEQGYDVYLLSNYPERMFKMHSEKFNFLPYVDGFVISYSVKLVKPDERIYDALCSKYGILPEESVFLDDRKENVETAKKLGFKGIRVTNPFAVRGELKELLEKDRIDE